MYTHPITSPVAGSSAVRKARPVLEVGGVRLQVAQVVRHAAVVGPGARLPTGRHADVLHGRRPRLIVGVVVLRPEWFEPELLRRESERDDEAGRDKRPFHHTHIFVDPVARYRKNQDWDGMELHPRLCQCSAVRPEQIGQSRGQRRRRVRPIHLHRDQPAEAREARGRGSECQASSISSRRTNHG